METPQVFLFFTPTDIQRNREQQQAAKNQKSLPLKVAVRHFV